MTDIALYVKALGSDYRVWARPASQEGGWTRGTRGEYLGASYVATVRKSRFHLAWAAATAAALDEEVAVQVLSASASGMPAPSRRKPIVEIEAEIAELHQEIAELDSVLDQVQVQYLREDLDRRRDRAKVALSRLERMLVPEATDVPDPTTKVDANALVGTLGRLVGDPEATAAIDTIMVDEAIVAINPLFLTFTTSVAVPTDDKKVLVLGPIETTVENTHRHPEGVRQEAMARLCLEHAWPVEVVAAGVPGICASLGAQKVAIYLSRLLKPLIGSKAASVAAGTRAPEVMAVLARELGLGDPPLEVDGLLAERIRRCYIDAPPPGPKGWLQATDDNLLARMIVLLHDQGPMKCKEAGRRLGMQVNTDHARRWHARGWVINDWGTLSLPPCRCGSRDVAYVAAPEVDGLVCMACRQDASGLLIPASWNAALTQAKYWQKQGFDIDTPEVELPNRPFMTEPIDLR